MTRARGGNPTLNALVTKVLFCGVHFRDISPAQAVEDIERFLGSFEYRDGDGLELQRAGLVDDLRVLAANAAEIADRLTALETP